ncbi:MAG: hypothetical protein CYPHOPRED_003552 [Cyphobasidiales sp. Tagirdzhanova-0007]|nr:MAG: hypothetical protein CYPHOPRED_003552 [Cyphobasidiales sp. Tagirdzhanova-0007]
MHRRTPSQPLRVRTVSVSQQDRYHRSSVDVHSSSLFSPSSVSLPSALPNTGSLANDGVRRVGSSASISNSSEKYGFVVYAGSLVAWYIYLVWALTPDQYLRWLGLEWYPSREWAILIPSWIMVAVVFVYIAYFALNLFNTPALDSLTCISDTQGHLLPKAPRSTKGFYAVSVGEQRDDQPDQDYIPPLYDLPVGLVNRAVFG